MTGAWLLPVGGAVATAVLAPVAVYAFSADETPAWIRNAESLHAWADDISGGDPHHWFGRLFVFVYLAGLGGLLLRRREHRPVRVVTVALAVGALADVGGYWMSDSPVGMMAGIVEFLNLPVLLGAVTVTGWRWRRAGRRLCRGACVTAHGAGRVRRAGGVQLLAARAYARRPRRGRGPERGRTCVALTLGSRRVPRRIRCALRVHPLPRCGRCSLVICAGFV